LWYHLGFWLGSLVLYPRFCGETRFLVVSPWFLAGISGSVSTILRRNPVSCGITLVSGWDLWFCIDDFAEKPGFLWYHLGFWLGSLVLYRRFCGETLVFALVLSPIQAISSAIADETNPSVPIRSKTAWESETPWFQTRG
jgi:hypothetical protein